MNICIVFCTLAQILKLLGIIYNFEYDYTFNK